MDQTTPTSPARSATSGAASASPFDLDRACADALARLNSYITRAAGQHMRALRRASAAGGKGSAA